MTDTPPPPPPPPSTPAGPGADSRPWWKRKRIIIPAAIVVLFVLVAIAGGADDDDTTATGDVSADDTVAATTDADDSDEEEAEDTTEPAAEEPEAREPESSGVGAVLGTGSGGLARLNSVTATAEPESEFATPSPGTTFTRIDVEICAGDDGQQANPLYWHGGLDDNSDATAALGSQTYETVDLAQGECQRGTIDLEVPDGRTVASVYLTSPLLSEIARWNLADPPVEVPGPLSPTDPPERAAVGETVDTRLGPATVHGITDGVAAGEFHTPPAGTTLTRLDVEICAGDEPVSTNPLYWYGLTAQNRWLSAELGAQDFETGEIAAGQCRRGTVDVAVPDGDQVTGVAFTDPGVGQVAGWSR